MHRIKQLIFDTIFIEKQNFLQNLKNVYVPFLIFFKMKIFGCYRSQIITVSCVLIITEKGSHFLYLEKFMKIGKRVF